MRFAFNYKYWLCIYLCVLITGVNAQVASVSENISLQSVADLFAENPDSAIRTANIFIQNTTTSNQDKVKAYIFLHNYYTDNEDYNDALASLLKAAGIYDKDRSCDIDNVYLLIGKLYSRRELHQKALEYFKIARYYADSCTDKQTLNEINTQTGNSYMRRYNLDSAHFFYKKALQNAKRNNDKVTQAHVLEQLGIISRLQKNYTKAFDYNAQYLVIKNYLNDSTGIAMAYNNLGFIYQFKNELEQALFHFKKAMDYSDDADLEASVLVNMGFIYFKLNHPDTAMICLENSLRRREKSGNLYEIAKGNNLIANGYIHIRQYNDARKFVNRAIDTASKNEDFENLIFAYNLLSEIYFAWDDYKTGIAYLKKSSAYKDTLMESVKRAGQEKLRSQYQVEYVEKVLQMDLAESEIRELRLLQSRLENKKLETEKRLAQQIAKKVEIELRNEKRLREEQARAHLQKQVISSLENQKKAQEEKLKEEEILRLTKENQLKETEAENVKKEEQLKRTQQFRNFLIGILVLFILFIIFLIIAFSERRRANKQLKIQNNEIKEQKEEIEMRNTQLSEAMEEIRIKNEHLEELNQEKNDLMSIVAHDLKSPLIGVANLMQLVQMKGTLNEDQLLYMGMVSETLEGGNRMIRDLLDINSIESGQNVLKPIEFNLIDFLEEMISMHIEAASQKRIEIQLNNSQDEVRLITDTNSLQRILDNVISNAIKFSPYDKIIEIRTWTTDKYVHLSVKDQGPGFTESDKEKAFKKFQKLSARPTAGEHSSGLGLSIVKTLTDQIGADIKLVSESGKGSEFIIDIPK